MRYQQALNAAMPPDDAPVMKWRFGSALVRRPMLFSTAGMIVSMINVG